MTASAATIAMFAWEIMAKTADSVICVVCRPLVTNPFARRCPWWYLGAPSATNIRDDFFFTFVTQRNSKTVLELPKVNITSFWWMCSTSCSVISSRQVPISWMSSFTSRFTSCFSFLLLEILSESPTQAHPPEEFARKVDANCFLQQQQQQQLIELDDYAAQHRQFISESFQKNQKIK